MSGNKKDRIDLSGSLDAVLAFNDPHLPDGEFIKGLVSEIFNDDVAIRYGTSDAEYRAGTRKDAEKAVDDAVRLHGLSDRNHVITEAYNRSANSHPVPPLLPKKDSPFLKGSDYLKWAQKKPGA